MIAGLRGDSIQQISVVRGFVSTMAFVPDENGYVLAATTQLFPSIVRLRRVVEDGLEPIQAIEPGISVGWHRRSRD